ncbi:hypothetical protein [Nocardia noduli]|uniref:hypothetical protein n=1 Tax=Nocardia noduli TaxID=2815722 RepID=UPI001C23B3BC|nr:hypothetical protein [Nocardia noduli]
MACGNNHISRAYLSSPPAPVASAATNFLKTPQAGKQTWRQSLGDRGESLVTRLLVEAQQHSVIFQHTPGERSQGVDIVTLDPNGRLVVTEVKTTAAKEYRAPRTKQNVGDHQLDAVWTAKNLSETGLVTTGPEAIGTEADQVVRQLAQFDVVSGTVSFWEVDESGQRSGSSPTEVWDASLFEDLD